jgi:transcriptional regulator with XRE-family HTH domain
MTQPKHLYNPAMLKTSSSLSRSKAEPETLGQRMARLRKERGFTQIELAQKADTIQAVISGYECGRVRPHAAMVACLAQALGITADELLGLTSAQSEKIPAGGISRRIFRRMQLLERMPTHDQKAVLKFIDALAAQHSGRKAG